MGELSRPIMTPVGVVYRSLHDAEGPALKAAQWAVALFGGATSSFNLVGPGRKGKYEAAIMATVPAGATCLQPRKGADASWFSTPEIAYVLFDSLETPCALYFHKRELFLKPGTKPPIYGYQEMSTEQ
ncbi:MAG TPA: hypothetical protein VIF15_13830 [Polyangiaceae bacterium]|jgi:hypothetical protein